jgi:hypothetical protein
VLQSREREREVMVAPDVKAETMKLMDQRGALEAEMDAIIARLTAPGGPGITGGLVDAEVPSDPKTLAKPEICSRFHANRSFVVRLVRCLRVSPGPTSTSQTSSPNARDSLVCFTLDFR